MEYIFFLGRTPALSLAEIQAILEKYQIDFKVSFLNPAFVILDIKDELDIRNLFVQMGGTFKIAKKIGIFPCNDIKKETASIVRKMLENRPSKKTIGYSIYFTKKETKDKEIEARKNLDAIFLKIKKEDLANFSIRTIFPDLDKTELSSASVFNNKLTNPNKGIEFNIIFSGNKIILGQTLIVQDVDSYSMRDYEKPGRDAKIGMMPPKLAQAMINLAKAKEGQMIFDPFCGTGTILQEALLNDYRVIGSDANGDQIERCKKNLKWISEKYILTYPEYRVFQASFNEAIKKLKPDSVDAIVTESTLGPVYKKAPDTTEIKNNYATLKKLYVRFLSNSKNILKNKARIVITLPAYQLKPKEYVFGDFVDSLEKLGYSIVCPLDKRFASDGIRITKRNTIIYSRPEQIVAREIIVFQNNK